MNTTEGATPAGTARDVRSAHESGQHWLAERFLSVAILLLSLWLLFSLALLPDLSFDVVREWLQNPLAAVPMALFIVAAFAHGLGGLKVAIDDYVHDDGNRIGLGFALSMIAIFGAGVALFALAKISLGAA